MISSPWHPSVVQPMQPKDLAHVPQLPSAIQPTITVAAYPIMWHPRIWILLIHLALAMPLHQTPNHAFAATHLTQPTQPLTPQPILLNWLALPILQASLVHARMSQTQLQRHGIGTATVLRPKTRLPRTLPSLTLLAAWIAVDHSNAVSLPLKLLPKYPPIHQPFLAQPTLPVKVVHARM